MTKFIISVYVILEPLSTPFEMVFYVFKIVYDKSYTRNF